MERATICAAGYQRCRRLAATSIPHLVRTGDNLGEVALLFILALDNGFDDAGMVGAEVHKAMRDPGLPNGLEEGKGSCVDPAGCSE